MHRPVLVAILALALTAFASLAAAQDLRLLTEPYSDESVALVKDLAAHMGLLELEVEVMPWARAYRAAVEDPAVMLLPTTRTPQREELFHWVGPIWTIQWVLYGLQGGDANPRNLEEARAVERIGTYRDDAREKFLKAHGFTNLDTANNMEMTLRKLLKGRVDLAAASSMSIHVAEVPGLTPGMLKPVLVFKEVDLYLAFSRDTDPAVVRKWREGFASFVAAGGLARHCCPLESCPESSRAFCSAGQ